MAYTFLGACERDPTRLAHGPHTSTMLRTHHAIVRAVLPSEQAKRPVVDPANRRASIYDISGTHLNQRTPGIYMPCLYYVGQSDLGAAAVGDAVFARCGAYWYKRESSVSFHERYAHDMPYAIRNMGYVIRDTWYPICDAACLGCNRGCATEGRGTGSYAYAFGA